ncbi:MAG TPA: NAD-dependent epimerase/dehydratase family protein [Humisphaera sp.]|nr:NAD-dependent epimerase/dehydratase family protein [Humisphaera sp.]
MKLLVTGAGGFLGRYVVAEALRRGHAVRAMVRGSSEGLAGLDHPALELVKADLRSRRGLTDAVSGVDAVLHLAAAKSGDLYAQYAGTVVATENLMAAMTEANVRRIVLISSFSVYDYLKAKSFSVLDENSPIEKDAFDRDEYAHTKLVQERLVREHASAAGWGFTILRPGVIYGRNNLFTARIGVNAGRFWLRIAGFARLPLTYVENCAEAIVLAAERDAALGQTLNVVDDDMPTQRKYAAMARARLSPKPLIVPMPFAIIWFLAGMGVVTNRLLFRGRAKIPGIFVPARLAARCKPLRFSNQKIKQVLGWKSRYAMGEALDRSVSDKRIEATPPTKERSPAPAEVAA